MSRVFAIVVLAAMLFGAVAYNVRARQAPPASDSALPPVLPYAAIAVTTERVRVEAQNETVRVVGTVRSDRQAAVTPKMPARIVAISVREGGRVVPGQTVATLDMADARAQVSGAEAGVDAARAQLRKAEDGRRARQVELDAQVAQARIGLENAKVKFQQAEIGAALQESSARSDSERARAAVLQAEAGVKQADLSLDQADRTLKRVEFLFSRGGISRAEAEGARTQAEIARAQKESAVAALRQAMAAEKPATETAPLRSRVSKQDIEAAQLGVRQAAAAIKTAQRARSEALRVASRDVEAAQAAVRQANAGRQGAVAQVGSSALTSPIAGVVTQLNAHPGEMAQPGMPLMTIVATDGLYVEATVPVRYAGLLTVGAPAKLRIASTSTPHSGTVTEVLPVGDGRTIPVRIRPRSRPAGFAPGVSATVEIPLRSGSPLRSVPTTAVRTEAGRQFVFVVVNGAAERREIIAASAGGERTAIVHGISAGDQVITAPPSALAPGSRVTSSPHTSLP